MDGIGRGSTPHIAVRIVDSGGAAVDVASLGRAVVAIAQGQHVYRPDVQVSGNRISVSLTQRETLALVAGKPVQVQVRIVSSSGDVPYIAPIPVMVMPCADEEVIAYE